MSNLVSRTSFYTLSIATSVFLLGSTLANAEIYKWRNNRGQIQYSDKPPVSGFSKTDRHELVNSLQAKDLCVEPTAKTAATASANKRIDANFFGNAASGFSGGFSGFAGAATPVAKTSTAFGGSIFGSPAIKTSAAAPTAAPASAPYSPLKATSVFGFGGSAISVFGSPIKTAQAKPAITNFGGITGIKPVAAAPAPTVAPKPTTVAIAPTPTPAPAPAASPVSTPTQTGPNILQSALMPAVDISKQPLPTTGFNDLRIQPTTMVPRANNDSTGQFRIVCNFSHMNNDDPIIYPNQQGASHNHTYFGNTSTNYKTNPATLSTTGNSTCLGGIMNRSAYWVPSMIDTATNTPITPNRLLVYYKTSRPNLVVTPPKGLRMIAGDSKSTVPQGDIVMFTCNEDYNSRKQNIPACSQGQVMDQQLSFPNCWDGKNLDSPDHKSHMAYAFRGTCPATHPVMIPDITFNARYIVNSPAGTAKWKLASDNYSGGPGGNSFHGDWMNGWDEVFSKIFTDNCLKKGVDCGAVLLGDGRMFF